jgi:hypothetical protein
MRQLPVRDVGRIALDVPADGLAVEAEPLGELRADGSLVEQVQCRAQQDLQAETRSAAVAGA